MSAIAPFSTVLVTGMTGFIGSHVTDQLLEANFHVRGTVRNLSKAEGLLKLWEGKYGKGKVEVVLIEDVTAPGALDDAAIGVSGIVHVASNVTFNPDPEIVINGVVGGVNSILESASRSPTVKRFVYTSSTGALAPALYGVHRKLDASSFNEEAVEKAWAPPPYTLDRAFHVYAASKTQGEQAVLAYAKEKSPHFVINSVAISVNFGKVLDPSIPASSGDFVKQLFNGQVEGAKSLDYQWFVDVQDSARLHIAALTNPNLKDERIIAYAHHFTWNGVLKHLRQIRPDHDWVEDFADDEAKDLSEIDNTRGTDLLKKMGRDRWTSLEESLRLNLESV